MNYTEHKFTLDVNQTASQVALSVKKGDTARRLRISLVESGYPYHMTKDCYAAFSAKKPDGHVIFNNCTIENCVISYDFTEQTVAAVGLMNCEVIVYGARGRQLTSASFDIIVEDSNYSAVESSSEANALGSLIAAVKAATSKGVMAPAIVCEAQGEEINLTGASNEALQGLRIFGKTTQKAEPAQDRPEELIEVETVVTLTDGTESQTMTILNSLPGVPVSRRDAYANSYTDSNGKHWVGDEIDLKRGVRVIRIGTISGADMRRGLVVLNQESDNYNQYTVNNVLAVIVPSAIDSSSGTSPYKAVCNRLPLGVQVSTGAKNDCFWIYKENVVVLVLNRVDFPDVESVEYWLAENDVEIQYILKTPVEIPLSDAEKAAFAALYTYKPNTTITNDAGAYMIAEYVADTKTYVDSNGGSVGSAVRVGTVTLFAANWIGTESPYHQTVYLPNVTENSMVDLEPSVEQLAIFHDKDLAFVTENEDGVVTVYSIGDKPTNDYTIQVSITEVNT